MWLLHIQKRKAAHVGRPTSPSRVEYLSAPGLRSCQGSLVECFSSSGPSSTAAITVTSRPLTRYSRTEAGHRRSRFLRRYRSSSRRALSSRPDRVAGTAAVSMPLAFNPSTAIESWTLDGLNTAGNIQHHTPGKTNFPAPKIGPTTHPTDPIIGSRQNHCPACRSCIHVLCRETDPEIGDLSITNACSSFTHDPLRQRWYCSGGFN